MSGQWEVVKSKNDRRSRVPVPQNSNKSSENKAEKPNILKGVKLEEILPKSQVKNLYLGKQNDKENKLPEKQKQNESKKTEKKVNKISAEPPKAKPPKSLEAGLTAIGLEELNSIYEQSKRTFPDAPIVWLKILTLFLNQKLSLEIQDTVFSNKPHEYPWNILPQNLKSIIEKAIKEVGKNNAVAYFDISLTSMVTDLSKGLSAVGYRFFLQYIALSEPKMVTENISKHIALRNSYQNRASVALSILWAVGNVGLNDLNCGIKVFNDLMLPLLEMKSYSHYIVKYLINLTGRDYETPITTDQYLLILDVIYSNKKNVPSGLQKDLVKNLPKLKKMVFINSKGKFHDQVEVFLKKISSSTNVAYQNSLCDILVEIFTKDHSTLASWNKVYSKNLIASAILLGFISNNYDGIKSNVRKSLKDLMLTFSSVNEELSQKKRKDDGLKEAISAVKKAQEEKAAPKKQGSCGRKFFIFSLIVALLAIFTEHLYRPDKSKEQLYGSIISGTIQEFGIWADGKLEENIPKPYYGQAKQIAEPYLALANDLAQIACNIQRNLRKTAKSYVDEKYPVVVASIDSYAPGLIDNTQDIFRNAFAKSVYYYQTGVNYLQNEVFVGQLSPENIQRVVVVAYNKTSEKAIEYYHWVYEKVQTSIK